ncbi:MAG TPA: amidohydrolase family protein [Solirubrobacteraceae bacterium]
MTALDPATTTEPTAPTPDFALIDCDVHPYFADGLRDLADYLPSLWRHRLNLDGQLNAGSGFAAMPSAQIPANCLYVDDIAGFRRDASGSGEVPGSDPAFVSRHLLDHYKIDRGVLVSGNLLGLGAMTDPDAAAAIASAYNDWMIEKWLSSDVRYRGALVVAPQDPTLAAQEIERVGDATGMVEILLPLSNIAMGNRHFQPIYAAAASHGLPIAVHPSGTENVFVTGPPMPTMPAYKIEWRTALTQVHQSNLISMLCHGIFEQFPALKIVITEGGFAWLPDVLWRLDASWRALRDEVPWVKRAPSEYIHDHVRFTTQPFPEAPRPADAAALCRIVDGEQILMYSSDYPHFDFDDPNRALTPLPDDLREPVFSGNARELFGDRLL